MATKRRIKSRRKSCKHGKLKRSVKTKSGRKRRCKKKPRTKKKNKMMKSKSRTVSRPKFSGGGGSTNYCTSCNHIINEFNLKNKSAQYMADIVPYSKLLTGKQNCQECLSLFHKNKNRLSKDGLKVYESSMRTLLPIAEKMNQAMKMQRTESKTDTSMMPDLMYNDMIQTRLKGLKKIN